MDSIQKRLRWACYGLTTVFVISVCIPLIAEWASIFLGHRSIFLSFQVTDEQGRLHSGQVANGNYSGFPAESMVYGYQAPEDKDLSLWGKTVKPMAKYEDMQEGFMWAHEGVLWTTINNLDYSRSDDFFVQGTELGFKAGLFDQPAILFPGAPLDNQTPTLKVVGKFPRYTASWEDDYFYFELTYLAKVPRWFEYNNGKEFQHGDFGAAFMSELPSNVSGTITHKKSGKVFNVSGSGIIEDASGERYSMYEFGGHDWRDVHFDNGWTGSLFVTYDDWQWGMNDKPHMGWIYDPEREEFHTFHAVKGVNQKNVDDEMNPPFHYAKSMEWLAFSEGGTLRLSESNLSYVPIWFDLKGSPVRARMAYGRASLSGEFIRRDGSVVKLNDGIATTEHFNKIIPDFHGTATWFLAILILSWGLYWGVCSRAVGRSIVAPAVVTAGLFAGNIILLFHWS